MSCPTIQRAFEVGYFKCFFLPSQWHPYRSFASLAIDTANITVLFGKLLTFNPPVWSQYTQKKRIISILIEMCGCMFYAFVFIFVNCHRIVARRPPPRFLYLALTIKGSLKKRPNLKFGYDKKYWQSLSRLVKKSRCMLPN